MTLVENPQRTRTRRVKSVAKHYGDFAGNLPRAMCTSYTDLYKQHCTTPDAPDKAVDSLLKRAEMIFRDLGYRNVVLDLGSGPQIFEKIYIDKIGPLPSHVFTLDIAKLKKFQLLEKKNPLVSHVTANGEHLPFAGESLSGALSSSALDYMPKAALRELHRVLKPGAPVALNLHHPKMIPQNLDWQLYYAREEERTKTLRVLAQWKYFRDNRLLYESATQIKQEFEKTGFCVNRVEYATDKTEHWWEVDIVKK